MNAWPMGAWAVFCGAIAIYILFIPRVNQNFYRPFLFHPRVNVSLETETPPELEGIQGKSVSFPSENQKKLYGWYFKNKDAKYTILFSHGNGGNITVRADLVELLLKAGASVFIYDYEGYGASAGVPTVDGICQDGEGAYKYLVKEAKVQPNSIVFYGESLGCGVASYLSSKLPCAGVILQSGFTSLYEIATEAFPFLHIYPLSLFPTPTLNSLEIMSHPHPPLLIIHGRRDKVVPYRHAQSLNRSAVQPKIFLDLPNSGHSDLFVTAPKEYVDAVWSFLQTLP